MRLIDKQFDGLSIEWAGFPNIFSKNRKSYPLGSGPIIGKFRRNDLWAGFPIIGSREVSANPRRGEFGTCRRIWRLGMVSCIIEDDA